jgi:hypothetical protein
VRANWIPTLHGRVEFRQPEKFVVVTPTNDVLTGISMDGALPNSFVIGGKIEPMPHFAGNFDPLRIHIHPINPWSNVDVNVDPSGEFRIYQGLSGLCVLTVLRERKCSMWNRLSSRAFTLPRSCYELWTSPTQFCTLNSARHERFAPTSSERLQNALDYRIEWL